MRARAMSESAKLLKVPEEASLIACAAAQTLTARTRAAKRASSALSTRSTCALNCEFALPTLTSQGMPAQDTTSRVNNDDKVSDITILRE